jgi:endonuclease/exonuclease/phosphatase (EEP) superfamily protein YafD
LSGRIRVLITALALAALLFSIVTLVVRARPLSNLPGLMIAVGSPYIPLVALVGLVLTALCRRKLLSVVAAVVLVAALAVQVPWYYFGRTTDVGEHADIRVLSSNLRLGQVDSSAFLRIAKEGADVVAVSELTPADAQQFTRDGIEEVFPYSVLVPKPGAAGIGLWSRFPLTTVWRQPSDTVIAAARLRIPGVRFDPVLASVHIISPVAADTNTFDEWRDVLTRFKTVFAEFAEMAGPGAVIAAGDFNSTPDMRQFRDLLSDGYRDAVEQTGAGFAPTFPANSWVPPLITLDHVLTRQASASSIRTVTIPGSDHRSLLATVEVPLDPTAS